MSLREQVSVTFYAEEALIAEVDGVAKEEGGKRSDAIRKLLRTGLDKRQADKATLAAVEDARNRLIGVAS